MNRRVVWSGVLLAAAACSPMGQLPYPSQSATEIMASLPPPSPTVIISAEPTLVSETQVALPEYALDVSFADVHRGWLLGMKVQDAQGYYLLASSTDGGRSWQPAALDPIEYQVDWWNQAGIFFADTDTGWFFYPGVIVSTGDGGRTWTQAQIDGHIKTIRRALDGTLWAFEAREASGVLWKVNEPAYADWEALAVNFPTDMRQSAELTVLDDYHWWLMYWASDESGRLRAYLLFTDNQGQTWTSAPSPCDGHATQGGSLIALDAEHYWLSCSQALTSVEGTKVIFTSSDGGEAWELKGKATLSGDNSLSTFGIASGFGATSPDFAYMSLDKITQVLVTHDGGTTWTSSPIPCSADSIHAYFLDELHGWVWGGPCVSWTQDGGSTWECSLLPDGRHCSPP